MLARAEEIPIEGALDIMVHVLSSESMQRLTAI